MTDPTDEPGAPDSTEGMNEFLAGDVKALARLFDQQRDRLWKIVSFRLDPRLNRRVDPDDVLQEAYIAAAQRLAHFDGSISPFLWLRLMVMQTVVDVHRRHLGAQARSAQREIAWQGPGDASASGHSLAEFFVASLTSPTQAALRGELSKQLVAALETMEPIDREVLMLRHFEELSNNEVAAVLGIQPKASSIRYVRAIQRLKDILVKIPGVLE